MIVGLLYKTTQNVPKVTHLPKLFSACLRKMALNKDMICLGDCHSLFFHSDLTVFAENVQM